jgi:hypothetical protein
MKDTASFVTQEAWEGFCRHTETVEYQYWERDQIIPDMTNINLTPGSDSENSDTNSQSNCGNSETDSECNSTMPDEDADTLLAQPL